MISGTAFVHDNFVNPGGGTRIGEELARCMPDAALFTSVMADGCPSADIRERGIRTTWMQRLPAIRSMYRYYFPLYPFTMRWLNVAGYSLVVTSCYGMAKLVRKGPSAMHICYCHSPTRWIWRFEEYIENENVGAATSGVLRWLVSRFKAMDLAAARDVDVFLANSRNVANRIRSCYGREAHVLHPGIDLDRYQPSDEIGDYYLVVSRLVAYKRIDLAIEACKDLGRPLLIVGEGPHRSSLLKLTGPNAKLLGWLTNEAVADLMSRCRAVIFPGEEDFGLVPLEASASGRPCIAYGRGGALETIVPNLNGLFFNEPTAHSLACTIKASERVVWSSHLIRQHAEQFDIQTFRDKFRSLLADPNALRDQCNAMESQDQRD